MTTMTMPMPPSDEARRAENEVIGDPFFGAGLGATIGGVGGGLLGAAGGALVGAGEGALGGAIGGGALGATLGPAGALAGGLLGAGAGAIGGGAMGAVAGGAGGSILGAGALGLAGSQFISESDFREFPDELAGNPLGPSGLEVCGKGAFGISGALAEFTNIEHWYLGDGETKSGLGPLGATGNPLDTTMIDQTLDNGTEGGVCVPMEDMFPEHANVDLGCVEELMEPGAVNFGNYGLGGICKDAVETILTACDPDTTGQAIPETPLQSIERRASEMLFGPPSLEAAMPPTPKMAPGT